MGKPVALHDDHTGAADLLTVDYPRPSTNSSAPRRPVLLVGDSGQHVSSDLSDLLRRRLRLAALITLAGFAVFLIRNLWEQQTSHLDLAIHSLVVAVLTLVATLLWSRLPLSVRALRVL